MNTTQYLNRSKFTNIPQSNDKKSYTIALILGSVLIAALFTQSAIADFMEKNDTLSTAEQQLTSVTLEKDKLQSIEKNLKDPAVSADIKRYASTFREDDIFENIFSNPTGVTIQSINIDRGQKTSNGLSLANISLSVSVSSEAQLINFLNYLTDAKATKRYVIKSLSYPYDSTTAGGSVNLQLGMYYSDNN